MLSNTLMKSGYVQLKLVLVERVSNKDALLGCQTRESIDALRHVGDFNCCPLPHGLFTMHLWADLNDGCNDEGSRCTSLRH